MKTQRPHGTGTIETTRDGKYRARFAFDGKHRESIEGSPFATYEEAADALNGVLKGLASQLVRGITLRSLGDKAISQRDREGYRSVNCDWNMWECYVEPWELVGDAAKAITRGDVKELLSSLRNKKTKKPLATQTKRNILNMLRAVFAYGVDAELLDANPCTDIKIKAKGSTVETSTFLTLEEATRLIAVSTDIAVALAIGTGLRSGELRSLLWDDVHLGDDPHIVVRFGAPGEPTKNGKIREVPLFGVALETLRSVEEGARVGVVLPSFTGWHRQKGRVVELEDWRAWKAAAGLTRPVRWHDLRHTCATLLLAGAWGRAWSYEEVKEMLGHSSVKVTERYAHAVGTLAKKAARTMRDLPAICPQMQSATIAKAREILERRGSDSNRRMTVLQTDRTLGKNRGETASAGSSRADIAIAFLRAVAAKDPHAEMLGLDLAEAVLDAVEFDQAVAS